MLGHVGSQEQGSATLDGACGQVLGQVDPDGRLSDQPGLRDQHLGLSSDVGGVPRRPLRPESRQHELDCCLAIDVADPGRCQRHGVVWVDVPERSQFLVPPLDHLGAVLRHRLVRAGLRPCPPIPDLRAAVGPGSSPGWSARHSASYRSTLARICAVRALNAPTYGASSRISPVSGSIVNPAFASAAAELRIGGDRGVADAVDRLDHVPHANRVQSAPGSLREHPRVDLEMQMPVRIAGA